MEQPTQAEALRDALEAARRAIESMKVEAETAAQGDEQMMLEACETISNEGLAATMAIRAVLADKSLRASQQAERAVPWVSYEDAIADPVFQQARSIMGTENYGQDRQLMLAIRHVMDAKGAASAKCGGVPDPRCDYLAACGRVCNKCGAVHRPELFNLPAAAPVQQAAPAGDAERRKKAERYDWLLDQAWFQDAFERYDISDDGTIPGFVEECARVIDAAIASQQP